MSEYKLTVGPYIAPQWKNEPNCYSAQYGNNIIADVNSEHITLSEPD